MERKSTPLKIFAVIDVGLAIVPIVYGVVLLIPKITNFLTETKIGSPDDPTEAPPEGPIFYFDTELTLAVYITVVLMGLIGVHAVQAFMGIVLFHAANLMLVEPLEASSKFRVYIIWSGAFLIFLLISLIVYLSLIFHFISWLIMSFLIVQIVFRALAILFVQSCRIAIRRQFLQSDVPWINPSLPTATL